ncbi:MAG: hypothetical protein HWN67_21140, partial [Candidatus Helarchaeota archaeon]|nr:hypothetical protein [Candidatus Helarchaeota archaeon]
MSKKVIFLIFLITIVNISIIISIMPLNKESKTSNALNLNQSHEHSIPFNDYNLQKLSGANDSNFNFTSILEEQWNRMWYYPGCTNNSLMTQSGTAGYNITLNITVLNLRNETNQNSI